MILRHVLVACALVVGLASPAAAAWLEAKSRHFIIYSEQKPAELQRFAEDLERFDQAFRVIYGTQDPPRSDNGKLTIYVLKDSDKIEALARRKNARGFYIIRPWGVRAFVHREREITPQQLSAQEVFFHEYLHHLMLENFADIPLPSWFVEGAAEFYSTAKIEKDGAVTVGIAPAHRASGLHRLSGLSIEELLSSDRNLSGDERELLYGRGWLLTHMLYLDPARNGQLGRYTAELMKGAAPLDAARTAFGDLKALDRDMERYLGRRLIAGKRIPAAMINPGPVSIRALGPGHAAILPVVIKSERGVLPQDAPAVLAEARAVAQRFPNDPQVLAALAQAELDVGDLPAAVASADKALAADPKAGKALLMKARAMLAMGRRAPASTDWAAVRRVIGQANRLDPDHAEPLLLFYQSFLAQGVPPTANAVEGLIVAHNQLPQSPAIRMLLVNQLMREGKLAEAARLFTPIAYDPHAGPQRQQRMALLAALKAGAAADARALSDRLEAQQAAGSGR